MRKTNPSHQRHKQLGITENITKVVNETREALNSTNTIITALDSRIVQLEQAQLSSATTSRATAATDDYAEILN